MDPYRKHKKRLMAEINVVPYIDVMLVLLVIFMITAPLLAQGIKVELPQLASKPMVVEDSETLVVTVDAKGQYYLDDRRMGLQDMATKIGKILRVRPQTPVVVRGDASVDYGKVVAVMQVLQDAGAPSIGLATQGLTEKRK